MRENTRTLAGPALLLPALLLASCGAVPMAAQAPPPDATPSVDIHLGLRQLDEDDWSDDDPDLDFSEQVTLGLVGNIPFGQTLEAVVGLWGAAATEEVDGVDLTGSTGELSLGARAVLSRGTVRPYVGAGVAFTQAEFEARRNDTTLSIDDNAIGFYVHAGLGFQLSPAVSIGLDVRGLMGTEYDFEGVDVDGNYVQSTVFVGISL